MIALSFRGIPFSWEERGTETTPRFVEHDFPQKAGRWHEDMAAGPRVFTFMAFIVAPTRELARARLKTLQAACADQRAGTLMHPVFGAVRCVCTGFKSKETLDKLGRIDLDLTFVEDAAPQYPIAGRWIGAALGDATAGARDATAAGFDQVWALKGTPSYIRDDAGAELATLGDTILATTSLLPAPVRTTVTSRAEALPALASVEAGQSPALVSIFKGFTLQPNGRPLPMTGPEATATMAALRPLTGYAIAGRTPRTFSRAVGALALAGLAATVRRLALIEQTETSRHLAFASADEAISTRDDLADRLDVEILAASDQASEDGNDVLARLGEALTTMRAEMIADLTERAASLKPVAHITLTQARPAIALAYALYGDDDGSATARARTLDLTADMALRNRVRDPGQMPGGVPLEYQAA